MASAIANPVRVDMNIRNVERGRFAKICVEVDLDKPVVGKICTKDHWYNIEYEGLRIICGIYGCYGRLGRACPMENVSEAVVTDTMKYKFQSHKRRKHQLRYQANLL